MLFLSVLVLWLGASPSRAASYAYGEHFVRLGQYWVDEAPAQSEIPLDPAGEEDVKEYRQQLLRQEAVGGPYADNLAEPLMALGWHYRRQGALDDARALFQRALHVVRINDGLYSDRQVPILQVLLDLYRLGGEYQALDERYDYYFRLFGGGKPPFTELRLRAALGYLRWQREALRLGIDDDESRRLLALYRLNESLLDGVSADPSVDWHWYRDLVLSQLKNLYLVQILVAGTVHQEGLVLSRQELAREWEEQDVGKRQLEGIQRDAASRGGRLLEQAINAWPGDADNIELARLHLAMGDWYQWLGREAQAREQYAAVAQMLSRSGQQVVLQQWLGQPVELPDNGAFWQPAPAQQDAEPVEITLHYDISAAGRVRNLGSDDAGPAARRKAASIKRKFRQIRFRPRWQSGTAEAVEQLRRTYTLLD